MQPARDPVSFFRSQQQHPAEHRNSGQWIQIRRSDGCPKHGACCAQRRRKQRKQRALARLVVREEPVRDGIEQRDVACVSRGEHCGNHDAVPSGRNHPVERQIANAVQVALRARSEEIALQPAFLKSVRRVVVVVQQVPAEILPCMECPENGDRGGRSEYDPDPSRFGIDHLESFESNSPSASTVPRSPNNGSRRGSDPAAQLFGVGLVVAESCGPRNERCRIVGDAFVQTHLSQNRAGEPAAHRLAFPGDDRTSAFNRLHRSVEARKPRLSSIA
jgi:hypothetical protein